jgi:hypothetical protein
MENDVSCIIPIYGMAACEVFIVGYIAIAAVNSVSVWSQVWLVFQLGSGGALGAVLAMLVHKKLKP